MTPKVQIIALLPKLSPAELAEVQTAIKFAGQISGPAPAPERNADDWLLQGIAIWLERKGLHSGGISGLRKRDAAKGYQARLDQLMPFLGRLEAAAGTKTRHRPRLALILADALGDWLQRRGMLSVSGMLQHIDKIPEALDEAFPGYVEAGLVGMILRAER